MRERVWVDPFKIGKAAVFQKMAFKLSRKKKSEKDKKVCVCVCVCVCDL